VQQGFASGAWTGGGITSTTAAAVALDGSNIHKTAVGFAEAGDLGIGTFSGQAVDNTTLVLRYTLSGDATLDGAVNTGDFNALALAFNQSGKIWSNGDFNYDGFVNALDFNAIATNFGAPLPSEPPLPALGALVPEPASFALPALALICRRQRSVSTARRS